MKYRLVEPVQDIRTKSGKQYTVPTYRTTGEIIKNKKELASIANFLSSKTVYKPHIRMK